MLIMLITNIKDRIFGIKDEPYCGKHIKNINLTNPRLPCALGRLGYGLGPIYKYLWFKYYYYIYT